jgi:hypothetical protein
MRRRWAERIVIAIAVMASIATSRKGWVVEATPPPPLPGKPMILTVEASQAPNVWLVNISGGSTLYPQPGAAWPGRGRYFVPAGARIQQIAINGRCSGGGLCSSECKVPDGTYVKVTSAEPGGAWIAEDRSAPVTTVLDAAGPTPSYRVTIEASRLPIAVEIQGAPPELAPTVWSNGMVPRATFYVDWRASTAQAAPVKVTWTVRATIQGECPDPAACAVPAGDAVRILSVVAKAPDEP